MLYGLGFIGLFHNRRPHWTVSRLSRPWIFTCTILTSWSRTSTTSWSEGRSWVIWVEYTTGGQRSPGACTPEFLARIAAIVLFVGFNLTFFRNLFWLSGNAAAVSRLSAGIQVLNVIPRRRLDSRAVIDADDLSDLVYALRQSWREKSWPATGLEWTTDLPPLTRTFTKRRCDWETYDFEHRPELA